MKKNTILYILLFFLIIVNGFFLYNYLGNGDVVKEGRRENPMNFIVKQLNFDDAQMELMEALNKKHHNRMMHINERTRNLKDALFSKISDDAVAGKYVDSITRLIGQKEAELDREAFGHFRKIEEICTDKQKEKFKSIIEEAIGKGERKRNGPPQEKGEGRRSPPPNDGGRMGPPPNH